MNQIINILKKILPIGIPTAYELAQRELADAKRALLHHQTGREYHQGMTTFYEQNVRRLETYVAAHGGNNE